MKRIAMMVTISTLANSFGFTPGPDFDGLISHTNSIPRRDITMPGYRETITDPDYGTRITRITGDPGTPIDGIPGSTWPDVCRHRYSTRDVFSADGKLIFLYKGGGYLIDGETYKPIRKMGGNPFWHPTKPGIMIDTDGNTIVELNARTGDKKVVAEIDGYSDFFFGTRSAPSYDGKYVGANAKGSDGRIYGLIIDIMEGTLASRPYDFWKNGFEGDAKTGTNAYRCSPTASGTYVHIDGWTDMRNNNNRFYDFQLNLISEVKHNNKECPGHADMALGVDGKDVRIGVSKDSEQARGLVRFDVEKGLPVVSISTRGASHTSGRNHKRPGWVYCSSSGANGEIRAVKADGTREERFCNVHDANHCGYSCEPQAVPSPDGTRVLWAGNWDGRLDGVGAFVVDARHLIEPTLILRNARPGNAPVTINNASGRVRINFGRRLKRASILLLHVNGTVAGRYRAEGVTSFTTGTDAFNHGVYVIKVKTSDGTISRKLIVER